MDRFLGIGLSRALGIAFFTIIMLLMIKVVVAKYPVPSQVADVVNTI